MKCLLIGIGGTGARVLEAFTYLSAAGVLGAKDEVPEVHMRMVDMDTENGNLRRLTKTLNSYNRSFKALFSNVEQWCAREIKYPNDALFTWQVGINEARTLRDKFIQQGENGHLLYGLYGNEELNLDLTIGCKGRPRIGSLEFTKRFLEDRTQANASFWNQLFSGDLQAAAGNGELRVMFVGSMFGGAGASGVPNLAKLVRDAYCMGDNKVGITLMAPFYNFNDTAVEAQKGAKSKEFMINSKAALIYYAQSKILDKIHSLYVVGGEVRPMYNADGNPTVTAVGSGEQCDPAMPELLVAALSTIDFFVKASNENAREAVVADTGANARNHWMSYPYSERLKIGMNRIQRLALIWRLIEKTICSTDKTAWKALHKNFKRTFGGNEVFDPPRFLEYTENLRGFLTGQIEGSRPLNIGVYGFLRELEKNGLGAASNIDQESRYFDAASSLDKPDRMAQICSGASILDLVTKLQRPRDAEVRGVVDETESRRLRFIAAATKACL